MRIVIAVAVAAASIGCGTLTPASFNAKAPEVAAMQGRPMSVVAQYSEPAGWRFNANGIAFDYDRNAFTDELTRLVSRSLSSAGISIGASSNSIGIRVIYLDFMFQGPCIVDYAVRYGDGAWLGGQVQYESSNFATACREALELAARDIVTAPRTRAYLGGS